MRGHNRLQEAKIVAKAREGDKLDLGEHCAGTGAGVALELLVLRPDAHETKEVHEPEIKARRQLSQA